MAVKLVPVDGSWIDEACVDVDLMARMMELTFQDICCCESVGGETRTQIRCVRRR